MYLRSTCFFIIILLHFIFPILLSCISFWHISPSLALSFLVVIRIYVFLSKKNAFQNFKNELAHNISPCKLTTFFYHQTSGSWCLHKVIKFAVLIFKCVSYKINASTANLNYLYQYVCISVLTSISRRDHSRLEFA